MSNIEQKIKNILPELKSFRHEMHQHPELGLECHETAKRILAFLDDIPGLDIKTGLAQSGIVATLNKDKAGPCVALRADTDALPIEEQTGLPYKSTIQGCMHACGHDGHTTCLLGAVKILSEMKDELPGPVRFLFQPGEEGDAGARHMIEQGVLEGVDVIFGLHGWPGVPTGMVGASAGPMLAGVDEFTILIEGRGTHAAMPHTGTDPILIGAQIVSALQAVNTKFTDPIDSVVLGITCFNAGVKNNIIPPTAELKGTLRTLLPETRKKCNDLLVQISTNCAQALGGKATVSYNMERYPPLINETKATDYVQSIATKVLGQNQVITEFPPFMGGEDFAFYLEKVPGSFFVLGLLPHGKQEMPMLHSPFFDFSDDAIATGVRMHAELALNYAT